MSESVRRDQVEVTIPAGRWREAQAQQVLAAWRASGESLTAFSRKHGLQPERVRWWRKQLRARKKKVGVPDAKMSFAAAQVLPVEAMSGGLMLRLPGGLALEVAEAASLPPSWVASLVDALGTRR